MKEIKVCITGSEKVGKTCLLSMLTGDEFNPIYAPTVGADLHKIVLYDRNLSILFWDLSGQQRYEEIVRNLLNTSDAILVCYASDDMGSYREMVEKVLDLKRAATSPSPPPRLIDLDSHFPHLYIVCTKKELSREGELRGMDFSEKNNITFLSTSAFKEIGKREILLALTETFAEKRKRKDKKCLIQ